MIPELGHYALILAFCVSLVQGKFAEDGVFQASEVLAKHDENYMPPEAAQAVGDAEQRAAANKKAVESATKTLKMP